MLDLATGKARAEVSVVREPVYVAVTPDEQFALVANHLPYGDARDPAHAAAISFVNLDTLARGGPPQAARRRDRRCSASFVRPTAAGPTCRTCWAAPFLPTTQLSRGWVITSALSIIDLQSRQIYATVLFDQSDDGAADPWGLALSRRRPDAVGDAVGRA